MTAGTILVALGLSVLVACQVVWVLVPSRREPLTEASEAWAQRWWPTSYLLTLPAGAVAWVGLLIMGTPWWSAGMLLGGTGINWFGQWWWRRNYGEPSGS